MATALLVTRGGLAARAARATGRGSRAAVAAAAASPDRPGTHAIDSAEEKERRSSSAFALGLPALVAGTLSSAAGASAVDIDVDVPSLPPVAADALADNPLVLLGGGAALVAVLGFAIVKSQDMASGRLIDRLMREAEKAEAFWKKALEAEAENEEKLESSLGRLNAEWQAVAKARKALEEAEARAYESERMVQQIREDEKALRVEAAKAWIENYKAKTKLEGTLKIGKKDG
uniref:Uncharacterized protein n=1 Tax=Chloropicon laureae TaxID=464258 RepID=A0A7S2YVF6_9CHLO